jgi:hypothetical protein
MLNECDNTMVISAMNVVAWLREVCRAQWWAYADDLKHLVKALRTEAAASAPRDIIELVVRTILDPQGCTIML